MKAHNLTRLCFTNLTAPGIKRIGSSIARYTAADALYTRNSDPCCNYPGKLFQNYLITPYSTKILFRA